MIKEITDYSEWLTFFNTAGSPSFLQSWEWGELNRVYSNYEILRLGIYYSDKLVGIAQALFIRAKRGNFIFIPHGPVLLESSPSTLQKHLSDIVAYLKPIAVQQNFAFIRMSPVTELTEAGERAYAQAGFRTAPIYMHAERIWVLPLEKSEEELLADMRKTTRYLIRRAPKDGVTIEHRNDEKAIEDFWKLYEATAVRENFTPFSKTFVDNEFKEFYKTGNADYFFGKADGKYLAGALVVYTESTAFYHQGASIHTKLPVPYALQWEAIREAKKRGCKYYNFWGILQEGRTPKAWSGLTLFKKGFGGKQIDYIPTKDYVISPLKYLFSWFFESYLQMKRGV